MRKGTIYSTGLLPVLVIMVLFPFALHARAQSPSLTIGSQTVCNVQEVLVPLTGKDLSNVGSITLFITYNDQNLKFESLENIDPQLNGGLNYTALENPARVSIVFSNIQGVNFANKDLLKMKFSVINETGDFAFTPGCELATVGLSIIPVSLNNGSLHTEKPSIIQEPANQTIKPGTDVSFQVSAPETSTYRWQESNNGGYSWVDLTDGTVYTGTQSSLLTIHHVPLSFDHYNYRCILTRSNCETSTNPALLQVNSSAGLGSEGSPAGLALSIYPNPVTSTAFFAYTVPGPGTVDIELYDLYGRSMGKIMRDFSQKGTFVSEKNYVSLPAGIYHSRYVFQNEAGTWDTQCKLVKLK